MNDFINFKTTLDKFKERFERKEKSFTDLLFSDDTTVLKVFFTLVLCFIPSLVYALAHLFYDTNEGLKEFDKDDLEMKKYIERYRFDTYSLKDAYIYVQSMIYDISVRKHSFYLEKWMDILKSKEDELYDFMKQYEMTNDIESVHKQTNTIYKQYKRRNNSKYISIACISFVLFLGCNVLLNKSFDTNDIRYQMDGIYEILPEEEYDYIEVNSDECLVFYIDEDKIYFNTYVTLCKKNGFDYYISEDVDHSFIAYNESNYSINVKHNNKDKYIKVEVHSPDIGEADIWPAMFTTLNIPEFTSHNGEIIDVTEDSLTVHYYNVVLSHYNNYIASIEEAGFINDVKSDDSSYIAYRDDGCMISLIHKDDCLDIMVSKGSM